MSFDIEITNPKNFFKNIEKKIPRCLIVILGDTELILHGFYVDLDVFQVFFVRFVSFFQQKEPYANL